MSGRRMAGEVWFPAKVDSGQGCAKTPEKYPAKPQGGFSHGPKLLNERV